MYLIEVSLFFFLQLHAVVAASRVNLSLTEKAITDKGELDITNTPITFYGKKSTVMDVSKMNEMK